LTGLVAARSVDTTSGRPARGGGNRGCGVSESSYATLASTKSRLRRHRPIRRARANPGICHHHRGGAYCPCRRCAGWPIGLHEASGTYQQLVGNGHLHGSCGRDRRGPADERRNEPPAGLVPRRNTDCVCEFSRCKGRRGMEGTLCLRYECRRQRCSENYFRAACTPQRSQLCRLRNRLHGTG